MEKKYTIRIPATYILWGFYFMMILFYILPAAFVFVILYYFS
jgi:hypothetical protein